MRLQRLTGLEREKIENEYSELLALIAELKAILADEEKVLEIIREELTEIKERYSNERRTEIVAGGIGFFEDEDLIPEENIVITLTHHGYIKRLPARRIVHNAGAAEVFKEWERMKTTLLNNSSLVRPTIRSSFSRIVERFIA